MIENGEVEKGRESRDGRGGKSGKERENKMTRSHCGTFFLLSWCLTLPTDKSSILSHPCLLCSIFFSFICPSLVSHLLGLYRNPGGPWFSASPQHTLFSCCPQTVPGHRTLWPPATLQMSEFPLELVGICSSRSNVDGRQDLNYPTSTPISMWWLEGKDLISSSRIRKLLHPGIKSISR